MAYRIDPDLDRDFVEEFRRNPRGPHSPGLQRVLNSLRGSVGTRQATIMRAGDAGGWVLAWLPKERGGPIEVEQERVFPSQEAAEWHLFRRRWQAATGEALEDEGPG
jgi:hypothetical protein